MSRPRIDLNKLRITDYGVREHEYSERDVMLYNIGVGATAAELQHVYESHPEFAPLPTFTCACALPATELVPLADIIPNFKPSQLLHGEQFLAMVGDIPSSGIFRHRPALVNITDKGKAAAVVVEVRTTDATGNAVAVNQFTTFVRGSGGFEVQDNNPAVRPSDATAANRPPDRPPDVTLRAPTSGNQAAIYRLSGDFNPLHIDPEIAAAAGFNRPILHGLCTLGIVTRHLMHHFNISGSSSADLRTLKARFAGHVFPGETLRIDAWQADGGSRIIFSAATEERGKAVLSHAALRFGSPLKPRAARL